MRIFITGGAGFIGCNLAAHHLGKGNHVFVIDNLSRPRTRYNLEWLQAQGDIHFAQADVRDFDALHKAMAQARPDLVVHLAGQVAVTTTVKDPRDDFEINALGTFNVLEAARSLRAPPALIYASTNKVYGGMEDVGVVLEHGRYATATCPMASPRHQPLDFHSPYGCSKGAGDQYVRDYARIYGLRTVVFRQSAIYGPRQFGVEDQGWVAHFVIAAVTGRPITIYGDGKQVRDMLYVSDLIAAYDAAWSRIDQVKGEIFNVGGGAQNTLSIWSEAGPMLEQFAGHPIPVKYSDWRPGDQPVFISNNSKAQKMLEWSPKMNVQEGARKLWQWVNDNRVLFD